jgi:phosphate:Na+ symporter
MPIETILDMIFNLLGGLFLFLMGMRYMSDGMQSLAGTRLRKMIGRVTDNRFTACLTGAGVTCLIQSSSVTAVMAISMVNAGLMTMRQSIGILLGADIGTTITAWIVSLNVTGYGMAILGIAGLIYLFGKNERVKFHAMFWLGLGLIFFGLTVMKHGMEPLATNEAFCRTMASFAPNTYWGLLRCVVIGSLVTAVMQSSSATIAITIVLATSGSIDFPTAMALVLGQNIGTTITAYLASFGMTSASKRTAYAHIIIKILGVAVVFPFFYAYIKLLYIIMPDAFSADIAKQIAFSHTIFNVIIIMLFLPLITPLCWLLVKLFPDHKKKEIHHLKYINARFTEAPSLSIHESFNAIIKMHDGIIKMMDCMTIILKGKDHNNKAHDKVLHREEITDNIQREIVDFVSSLMRSDISMELVSECRHQLRIADEYESIGDYITVLVKLYGKLQKSESSIVQKDVEMLMKLHERVYDYLNILGTALKDNDTDIIVHAKSEGENITKMAKSIRDTHLSEIKENNTIDSAFTLAFIDMLQSYRKIRAHAFNIAEAICGDK